MWVGSQRHSERLSMDEPPRLPRSRLVAMLCMHRRDLGAELCRQLTRRVPLFVMRYPSPPRCAGRTPHRAFAGASHARVRAASAARPKCEGRDRRRSAAGAPSCLRPSEPNTLGGERTLALLTGLCESNVRNAELLRQRTHRLLPHAHMKFLPCEAKDLSAHLNPQGSGSVNGWGEPRYAVWLRSRRHE